MNLSQLASELRENGDRVLNGTSKLSLSRKLLKELNESFSLLIEERETLNSTFQVISGSNSKLELLLDLQFLHDFIQRTVALKLVQEDSYNTEPCNINKFKNLKLLELRKIPIVQVVGLQTLRSQLKYIICVHGLNSLKELFVGCGGDNSQGFVWTELKEAMLCYNNLQYLDKSFEYVPWLQILDLSHNQIENAQALDCLTNLKQLSLSFNHLESVPIFKREFSRNLQTLLLKSNFIEDLTGLEFLENLTTLDLSCNCLVDHQCLHPLSQLAALQWLNLEGNPLSFHPHHRSYTAKFLHSNIISVQFVLDRVILSKSERLLIGTFFTTVAGKFVMYSHRNQQSSLSSSHSGTQNYETTSELLRSQNFQKGRKIRTAIISDDEHHNVDRDDQGEIIHPKIHLNYQAIQKSTEFNEDLSSSINEKIENLREQYGEDWLKRQSGSLMHDILGLQKPPVAELTSILTEEDFIRHAGELYKSENIEILNTPSHQLYSEIDKTDVISELSANNTFVTASESSMTEEKDISSVPTSSSSDEDEEIHDDEQLFVAQYHLNSKSEEIFVILTNNYIIERDSTTGKIKSKWLLGVVSFCEMISSNPPTIRIEFDTVRKNMKQREYILQESDAKRLLSAINEITSKRTLSDMNQVVYCCMKCWSQFSQEKDIRVSLSETKDAKVCPNCQSNMVYEMDDEMTPTNKRLDQGTSHILTERAESPSECSIASEIGASDLVEVNVAVEVHTDIKPHSSFSANRSAVSVQESMTSHVSEDDSKSTDIITKKYESDIEVISNPSQSSIEVLDDHYRPNRKRSSEERRMIVAPSLVTIPDVVVPTQPVIGLAESSSSGSYTESICTTYDTHALHASRPASSLDIKPVIQEETDISQTKPGEEKFKNKLFTSILEGLFSGPTEGKKSKSKVYENEIEFQYSDFTNVDHRIKYYLYQSIFEHEEENFVWLLKCVLFNVNMKKPQHGCVVLSTHTIYMLHIKHFNTGEDISSWLLKKESYAIERLLTIYPLEWNQGIGLVIKHLNKDPIQYLCILQDRERTSNFISYLNGNLLPKNCVLQELSPEGSILNLQQLLISGTFGCATDPSITILTIFCKCSVTESDKKALNMGVFVATSTDLFLIDGVGWLLPGCNLKPIISHFQPYTNLVAVDVQDVCIVLHYLGEDSSTIQIWTIQFETESCVKAILDGIKEPWEEFFGVPLQVNYKEKT